jgi:hypothetical protein
MRVAASGIGVMTGMVPSRSSATAISVSAGTYRNGNTPGSYGGGSLTSIPFASSGKLRFDLVVFDVADTTLKRIPGDEDTPNIISSFLENDQPQPPELSSPSKILLGIARISSSGIDDMTFGHYSTSGIANMIVELPFPLSASTAIQFSATSKILARKTTGAGPGEECSLSDILELIGSAVQGDGIYRGASGWVRAPRIFGVDYSFGDGSTVLVAGVCEFRIPIACKIVAARIQEVAVITSSITCTLYKHALGAAKGSALDSYALASADHYEETGLNIAVSAGDLVRIETSGITAAKQILCSLQFEAT